MSSAAKGVSNFRNEIFGINDQARFAQAAATAQQQALAGITAEARASRERMLSASQSPQQLAALERSLGAAQQQVDIDLKQLNAIDPAIMEASKQVLNLLKGDQAAINNPLMQQRQSQRQMLLNSLRAQFGPGAENSAAGLKALRQFDMETNQMLQSNQMNSLGNVFNIATKRVEGPGVSNLLNVAQGFGNYQGRIAAAEQAGSENILRALGGEAQMAGAQYTGDILKSGARRQFFQQMEDDGRQIGRSWATFGMSEKGGKASNGGGSTGGLKSGGQMGGQSDSGISSYWDKNPYSD